VAGGVFPGVLDFILHASIYVIVVTGDDYNALSFEPNWARLPLAKVCNDKIRLVYIIAKL
jgi:hypothetical protein